MADTIWDLPKNPFRITLSAWQHGDYYDEIEWVDGEGDPEAFPENATATMHVREYAGASGPPLLVVSVEVEPDDRTGVLALSATSNEMNIPARPEPMTTPGMPGAFAYDLWIEWSAGAADWQRPFAYGPFRVVAAVTTP